MISAVTRQGFLQVNITPDMLDRAKAKAEEMGRLNNSIREGEGNIVGFLGEEICLEAFRDFGATSTNTYQHDLSFSLPRVEGSTWEVKSKDRTVDPLKFYEASVADYNAKQRADHYLFTSITRDGDRYVTGFICGFIEPLVYKANAKFLAVGNIDPSNGWKVSADCYNMQYYGLRSFRDWFEEE